MNLNKRGLNNGWFILNRDKIDVYDVYNLKLEYEKIKDKFEDNLKAIQHLFALRDLIYNIVSLSNEKTKRELIYFSYFTITNPYIYPMIGFLLDLYLLNVVFKGYNFLPIQYINEDTELLLFRSLNYFYYDFSTGILWDLEKNRFISERLTKQKNVLGISLYTSMDGKGNYYVDEDYLKKNSKYSIFGLNSVLKYLVYTLFFNFRTFYLRENFEDTKELYIEFTGPIIDYTSLDFFKDDSNYKPKSISITYYNDLFVFDKSQKNKSLFVDRCIKFDLDFSFYLDKVKEVLLQRKSIFKNYVYEFYDNSKKEHELGKINYYFLKNYQLIQDKINAKYEIQEEINELYNVLGINEKSFYDSFVSERLLIMNLYYILYLTDLYSFSRKYLKIQDNKFLFFNIEKLNLEYKKLK